LLDHISINVSDLDRSRRFYAMTLKPLGYRVLKDGPASAGFGVPDGDGKPRDPGGDFWISQDAPESPLTHFAFSARSREAVDAFFEAALEAGGVDNGQPDLRPRYHAHYYAAFILNPDGYNLEAVCHSEA